MSRAIFFTMSPDMVSDVQGETSESWYMFNRLRTLFADPAVQTQYKVQHLALHELHRKHESWIIRYNIFSDYNDATSLKNQLHGEPKIADSILDAVRKLTKELDTRESLHRILLFNS